MSGSAEYIDIFDIIQNIIYKKLFSGDRREREVRDAWRHRLQHDAAQLRRRRSDARRRLRCRNSGRVGRRNDDGRRQRAADIRTIAGELGLTLIGGYQPLIGLPTLLRISH